MDNKTYIVSLHIASNENVNELEILRNIADILTDQP